MGFSLIMINLLLAILANTYNMFNTKSQGIYLSKVIYDREELLFDESFGAFMSAIPPFNVV